MPANVESMFSVRQVPWHGLGIILEEAPDSEVALIKAGLAWAVESQPVFLETGLEIPNVKANVRATDQTVLGLVSDRYRIVQNREAFMWTDQLLGEARYETAGSLNGGRTVWLCAELKDDFKLLDDPTTLYLIFANSHDGSSGIRVCCTPIRVVCQNTLNLAIKNAKRMWTSKHTTNINARLEEAQRALKLATEYRTKLETMAEELVKIKVGDTRWNGLVENLIPLPDESTDRVKNNVDRLRSDLNLRYGAPDLANYKGTGWAAINAVSDHITHSEPNRSSENYKENLFEKVMTGHPMLDKALDLIRA